MNAGTVGRQSTGPVHTLLKNILVLTSWTYRSGLIQTYTLPYLKLIRSNLPPDSEIHLMTLEQSSMALDQGEAREAVSRLAGNGIKWMPFPYRRFGLRAMAQALYHLVTLLRLCRTRRIAYIHCFCTPAATLGTVVSLLTGTPLIVDSYEPHAEAMVETGTWRKDGLAYRILFFFEGLQSKRAQVIIATTPGMRDYAKTRYGVRFERFYVKPACVDLELFKRDGVPVEALREELGLSDKLVCVYAGKTGGIYLKDEIFDLLKVASDHWGDRFRVLFLTTDTPEDVRASCLKAGVDPSIVTCKFVEHKDMYRYLALADFALTPVKPVPTKRYSTPIKDGEYWAMGLPVIITRDISDDSAIIERNGIGSVLRDLSKESYRRSIGEIDSLLNRHPKDALYLKIRKVAEDSRGFWRAERIYREIYGGKAPRASLVRA